MKISLRQASGLTISARKDNVFLIDEKLEKGCRIRRQPFSLYYIAVIYFGNTLYLWVHTVNFKVPQNKGIFTPDAEHGGAFIDASQRAVFISSDALSARVAPFKKRAAGDKKHHYQDYCRAKKYSFCSHLPSPVYKIIGV